jgi:hypothetical protein
VIVTAKAIVTATAMIAIAKDIVTATAVAMMTVPR